MASTVLSVIAFELPKSSPSSFLKGYIFLFFYKWVFISVSGVVTICTSLLSAPHSPGFGCCCCKKAIISCFNETDTLSKVADTQLELRCGNFLIEMYRYSKFELIRY